jgi:HEPN domain-containing protein
MVLSEAEGFLKMARADLATAVESSDPARFREAAWGFWLQQAAEKGPKAWLHQLNLLPPRSHDLAGLLLMLMLKDAGAAIDDYENLERLTEYAVQFRYELDLPPLALDRAEWNEKVKEFLDTVAFHLAG